MDFKVKPWAHQLEAIRRAEYKPYFGLFFEQGTGKTSTTINILRCKFQHQGRLLRTIIFGPPIVVENWRDEWAMHSKIKKQDVIPLTGSGKKRLQTFLKVTGINQAHQSPLIALKDPYSKQVMAYNPQGRSELIPKIFITNYEALLMKDLFHAFVAWRPEVLVFDECHRLKSYKSKRSQLAEELANMTVPRPLVYGLSGTPILNSPLDIFQQFKIIDGGESFGKNFFAFRGRYFRDRNAGMNKSTYFPKWEPMTKARDDFDALKEMNQIIFKNSMRVEKKDCLDLPPEIHQIIKVGMTPEQAKLYKEMKNELITFMDGKACVASLALTKALRLMQIASGFLNVKSVEALGDDPNGAENNEEGESLQETLQIKETPKLQALKSMLEDLTENHKVLVWATWKANYEQIKEVCKSIGVGYVEVHGGITAKQKQLNIEQFKTDPSCRVFIGHPGSGGIGINLVEAPYSIFYSRTFSLEHFLQAKARNHRGGSEIHDKITHYSLVCENTIEELIVKKLANKQEISDKILGELRENLELEASE